MTLSDAQPREMSAYRLSASRCPLVRRASEGRLTDRLTGPARPAITGARPGTDEAARPVDSAIFTRG